MNVRSQKTVAKILLLVRYTDIPIGPTLTTLGIASAAVFIFCNTGLNTFALNRAKFLL